MFDGHINEAINCRWKAGVGAQLVEDRKNALKDLEHMLRTKALLWVGYVKAQNAEMCRTLSLRR